MKRIFAYRDRAAVTILQGLLADEGVESVVQNENMAAVAGRVPFELAVPEIWVRDQDEERALQIVEQFETGELAAPANAEPWRCLACGQSIEGQFTACWKCGTPREPVEPAS
jgi:hypothetical protein